jgi:PAS domain S-box-containing protein
MPEENSRKQMRKASEEEYQTLVDNLRAGVYRVTGGDGGRFIRANKAMMALFGFKSMEELNRVKISDLYVDPEERVRFIEEVRQTGNAKGRELRLKRKDGTPFWASCTASIRYDDTGGVEHIEGIIEDVTERKNTEQALRDSEEEHRTLLENLRTAVYRVSGKGGGHFIKANTAMMALFGFESMEDLGAATVADLYIDQEDRLRFVNEVQRKGYARGKELRLKKTDGTPFWGACTAAIRYDEDGNIQYFEGIIEDITERKTAETALRESEEEHRSLLENLRSGVYRVTGKGGGEFIRANSAMISLFGFESWEDLKQVTVADLYAENEDRIRFVEEVFRKGYAKGKELRLKKKDGTPFWGACTAAIHRDEDDHVLYVEGIVEDITDRKRAEEALRHSNEILNNILSASPVGIGLLEDDIIQWANTEMSAMFGFGCEDECKGQEIASIYTSADEYERVIREIKKNLKSGLPPAVDAKYQRRDGQTFVGHFKMSCPDPSNPSKRAIFTIHDISWRLQAENERLQKEKLHGVLEMAGAVCHEMNQPLQGISGYAETCMFGLAKDDPLYDKLKKIVDLSAKMGQITNKLQHITTYETKDYTAGVKIIDIDRSTQR